MPVVENDEVSTAAITSREYVPEKNGVAVSTRVPSNVFAFSDGGSIAVSGVVEMKLAGQARRLEYAVGGGIRSLQQVLAIASDSVPAPEDRSPFALSVLLSGGDISASGQDAIVISDGASVAASKWLVFLVAMASSFASSIII